MHSEYASIEGDKEENLGKDTSQNSYYSISDETDSDVDSIKCVYCSQSYGNYGPHRCHVTCTIENNKLQNSSSNETLVASEIQQPVRHRESVSSNFQIPEYVCVSCVLCDEVYDQYDDYVIHLNKCTTNVKLHHFVCPVCHELFTAKLAYLEHLKVIHFKVDYMSDVGKYNHNISDGKFDHNISDDSNFSHNTSDVGVDCVDFAPMIEKTRKPKAVRRQIGWSIEDIYQEIECKKVDEKPTATSSPIKNFFSKLGNE